MPDYRADEVAGQTYEWLKRYRVLATVVVGVLVVILVVVLFWVFQKSRRHEEASLLYDRSLGYAAMQSDTATRIQTLKDLVQNYGDVPVAVEARVDLADLMYAQGNYVEAQKYYQAVVESAGAQKISAARARLGLAYTAEQTGDYDKARVLYQEVVKDGLYVEEAKRMLKTLENPPKLPWGVGPEGTEVMPPAMGTETPTAPPGTETEVSPSQSRPTQP